MRLVFQRCPRLRLLLLNHLVYLNLRDPVLQLYLRPLQLLLLNRLVYYTGVPEPKRARAAAVPRASPAAGVGCA